MFDMEDMIGKLTQATGISFNIKDFRLGGLKFDEGDPYCFSFSKGGLDFHYNIRTRELQYICLPAQSVSAEQAVYGSGTVDHRWREVLFLS